MQTPGVPRYNTHSFFYVPSFSSLPSLFSEIVCITPPGTGVGLPTFVWRGADVGGAPLFDYSGPTLMTGFLRVITAADGYNATAVLKTKNKAAFKLLQSENLAAFERSVARVTQLWDGRSTRIGSPPDTQHVNATTLTGGGT
jgi:hypothetical protein